MTPIIKIEGVFMACFILQILLDESSAAHWIHQYQYVGKLPAHSGIEASLILKTYLVLGKLTPYNSHQNKIT